MDNYQVLLRLGMVILLSIGIVVSSALKKKHDQKGEKTLFDAVFVQIVCITAFLCFEYFHSDYLYLGPRSIFTVLIALIFIHLRRYESLVWLNKKMTVVNNQVSFESEKDRQQLEFLPLSKTKIFLRIGFALILWTMVNVIVYNVWVKFDYPFDSILKSIDFVIAFATLSVAIAMMFPDLSRNIFEWRVFLLAQRKLDEHLQEQQK